MLIKTETTELKFKTQVKNKEIIDGLKALNFTIFQIPKGMVYLESKGFLHKDLAARNIVMTDINQIKFINLSLSNCR